MKNQSSLNDIFRFVQLRGGNILKSYPLKITDSIQAAKNKSAEEKIELANTFLSNLNFTVKRLVLGQEIKSLLNSYSDKPKTTVGQFYNAVFQTLNANYDLEDDFQKDLGTLSELVYFSHYSTFEKLSDNNLQLYVMYQVLERARTYIPFRKFLLHKIKLLGLGRVTEPFIKSVGVADLLVVKQHLLRYEETEIAHIENVMKGETRSREHRFLDRFEETLIYENEKSVETEKESESNERFEMNRETSKTIQEDQKFSTDLSVSGTYGPTTVVANLALSMESSETTETSSSSEYAKDIMDRSLEKVNERVRTERITKIIKENETKDLHSFTNVPVVGYTEELNQISGIYQFVDKIYKAQVFNYGQRQMFDLMIPEPASYITHLNKKGNGISDFELKPPPKLEIYPHDLQSELKQGIYQATGKTFLFGGKNHYTKFATLYQATNLKLPPQLKTVTFSLERPKPDGSTEGIRELASEGRDFDEGYVFYPPSILKIDIPLGYIAKNIDLNIQTFNDSGARRQNLHFFFNFGGSLKKSYQFGGTNSDFKLIKEGGKNSIYSCLDNIELAYNDVYNKPSLVDNNKFQINYSSQDSANHSINLEIACEPTHELIQQWQLETYDLLLTAYQDRLMEYESKLAQYNADRKAQESFEKNNYGVPPSKQKQVILTEFKKHAISLFTDNLAYSPDDVLNDTTRFNSNFPVLVNDEGEKPPKIDRVKAKKQGDFIRFFEQAFEWSQMQYALYPYFWSKQDDWDDKFKLDDPNYEYQQFIQASAARLVLSVRPGFEEAVVYYLETGNVWGEGGTPSISDPLYISIVDEIREQSGNTKKEPFPVGKPWEVRLPTSLIKLKADDDLPKWKLKDGEVWEWDKDESL